MPNALQLHAQICRLPGLQLVIEAIAEGMEVKKGVLQALDSICKAGAIIDANTSLLSVTELASATYRLESVIGTHFFNPVPAMKLRGQLTSDKAYEAVARLTDWMGKSPVDVRKTPRVVVCRILIPMINEAVGILADGVASREERDTTMQMGANHPMGPLALGGLIGLNVRLVIMSVLHDEFGDPKYRPHPHLQKMVRIGQLGHKRGTGFYSHTKEPATSTHCRMQP